MSELCISLYVSTSAGGSMAGVFLSSRCIFWLLGRPHRLCHALSRTLGWRPCQPWLFSSDPVEWARESAVLVTPGVAPWGCNSISVYPDGNKLFPKLYIVKYELSNTFSCVLSEYTLFAYSYLCIVESDARHFVKQREAAAFPGEFIIWNKILTR